MIFRNRPPYRPFQPLPPLPGARRPGLAGYIPADLTALLNDGYTADTYFPDPTIPGSVASLPELRTGMTMEDLASDAEQFFGSFGGASQATPDQPIYPPIRPSVEPPPGSQIFETPFTITTPAANGVDTTVGTLFPESQGRVPDGWDGYITQIANIYTGPGFTLQTIGAFTWRIIINGFAVKNFDAIQFSFGEYTDGAGIWPYTLQKPGIPIYANDIVQWVVNHTLGDPLPSAGTNILCFFGGFIYSNKSL